MATFPSWGIVQSLDRRRGYLAIVVAAVIFGVWPNATKIALEEIHPLTIAFYSQFLSGLVMLPALRGFRLQRSDVKLLLATIVTGSALAPVLYFYGLERTTASNAVLLSNTESLFTMTLAYVLLGERLNAKGYVALATIAVGAFFVTTELRFGDVTFFVYLVGNLLLIVAACSWALNNVGSTVLIRRMRILPLVALQLNLGAAILFPIALISNAPLIVGVSAVPILLFLAVGVVLGFSILFFYSFRTIGAMRTGSILSTSSLWGILLALYLFPEQKLGFWQIVGGALMIGALIALYVVTEPRPLPEVAETLKPAASDGPDSP